jgi:hypothetical protein
MGMNRRNLKIINLEHELHPEVNVKTSDSEIGVQKDVLLATSFLIISDNFWVLTQNDMQENLEREGRRRIKSQSKINTKTHAIFWRGLVPKNLLSVEEAT